MELIWYSIYNFFIYGFMGWIVENSYSYYKKESFQEDGFLNGPFKPMYGFAMAIVLFIFEGFKMNISYLVPLGFFIPTLIEYITGELMKKRFKKSYWDYSHIKFNYKGIICLSFSISWIILIFIGVEIFHGFIFFPLYKLIHNIWPYEASMLFGILLIDFLITIKNLNLNEKNIIIYK